MIRRVKRDDTLWAVNVAIASKRCDDRPLVDWKRSGRRLQRLIKRNILELCLPKTLDRLAEHTPHKNEGEEG